MIRVGAVSYLNTKPLLWGFEQGAMQGEIQYQTGYPATVAEWLLTDQIDIGLVPVAIIPQLKFAQIVGNHCIGTEGEVASVCLFHQVPLKQVKTVLLDYQSRTSVALTQILSRHHFGIQPAYLPTKDESYIQLIKEQTAGVIIGDRAMKATANFAFKTDLGQAWVDFSGLPFVFAAWVANKPIDPAFAKAFAAANQLGLDNLFAVVKGISDPGYDVMSYFTTNISYHLDEKKLAGLDQFLHLLQQNQ